MYSAYLSFSLVVSMNNNKRAQILVCTQHARASAMPSDSHQQGQARSGQAGQGRAAQGRPRQGGSAAACQSNGGQIRAVAKQGKCRAGQGARRAKQEGKAAQHKGRRAGQGKAGRPGEAGQGQGRAGRS